MPSTVPNNPAGIAKSRVVRGRGRASALFKFYNAIRAIDRDEGLAPTNAGIALQLDARGIKTRGIRGVPGTYNQTRVGEQLRALGLHRSQIEEWKDDARAWGFDHGVSNGAAMVRQLWLEWQWHIDTLLWDVGVPLDKIVDHPFDPEPLFRRPDEWIAPEKRFPDSNARMVPGASPHARIVYKWLKAFMVEEDEKPTRKRA